MHCADLIIKLAVHLDHLIAHAVQCVELHEMH